MTDSHEEDSNLIEMTSLGDTESLKSFLTQNPVKIDSTLTTGRSLLHIAVGKGQFSCVKLLLEFNIDVNRTDNFGNTALHYGGHQDILEMLLEYGIDVNHRNNRGDTAFTMMKRKGIKGNVMKILESKIIEGKAQEESLNDGTRNILLRLDPHEENGHRNSGHVKNVWDEFYEDLGSTKFILLLGLIFLFSLYMAISITGYQNLFDNRILVSEEHARKIEL